MRGKDEQQLDVFSYVSPEQRVPQDHPLRPLRVMTDEALRELQPRFHKLYAKRGRPSIAPEKLLRALLLQVLYTIRSERQLMEQLDYNLLFRWFVGLNMDDPMWDVTVFTKNRERLLKGKIAQAFFQKVLEQARERSLLSEEHFTVDGTLIEAWAGQKSFQRKDKSTPPPQDGGSNPTVNFHGQERRNQTHQSTTDPESMLYRKSGRSEVELHGACVDGEPQRFGGGHKAHQSEGNGRARCSARHGGTDSGHQACDVGRRQGLRYARFREQCGKRQGDTARGAKPARPAHSAIDERTTRHVGYAISQRKRKRIEESFGWIKTIAGLRKTRHRGSPKVGWMFTFAAAAYNLVRMRNLAIQAT